MGGIEWTVTTILAACAGALMALAFSLLLIPTSSPFCRVARVVAIAAIAVGLGAMARAARGALLDTGEWGDTMFRVHYLAFAVAAVSGPAIIRLLDSRWGYAMVVAAPATAMLFAAFVATPAFTGPSSLISDLSEIGLRWAFIGLVVVSVVSAGITAVRTSSLAVMTSQRSAREIALSVSFAYLVLASLFMVQAISDVNILGWESRYGLSSAVALSWIVTTLSVHRSVTMDAERTARHLRKELDTQAYISLRDSLTGLFNRGYLFESMHQAMEHLKRSGEPFAVCIADLDDFKKINDRYGHPMGDLVLQTVAKTLMRTCRPYDTAARYGGEEFVVLLRNVGGKAAEVIANRLRCAIGNLEFPVHDGVIRVTATMGVVSVTHPCELSEVIREADEAMYEGKRNGKNQVRVSAKEGL